MDADERRWKRGGQRACLVRKFLILSRSFAELLEAFIRKHQNRALESAAVIEGLIAPAKQRREAAQRGAGLGLSNDEAALFDALEVNDGAVKVLGDENLRLIARELIVAGKRLILTG